MLEQPPLAAPRTHARGNCAGAIGTGHLPLMLSLCDIELGEQRQIIKIAPPLHHPPLVAGLVLGAHQRMRAAFALDGAIHIAPALLDRVHHVAAISLLGLELPGRLDRAEQELAQAIAVRAAARQRRLALPIAWRAQVQRHAGLQMVQPCRAQALAGGLLAQRGRVGQAAQRGNDNLVQAIGLGPGQPVAHGSFGQSRVDAPQRAALACSTALSNSPARAADNCCNARSIEVLSTLAYLPAALTAVMKASMCSVSFNRASKASIWAGWLILSEG